MYMDTPFVQIVNTVTDSTESAPVAQGVNLRGLAMTRLETFVDAAFAFAVTLLVIAVDDVPRTYEELVIALKSIPVFVGASAQVFVFWIAHRYWSRCYGLDDWVAVLLTLILVMSLLVMVFPLRVVYTFAASDMTGGWIPPPFKLDPVMWAEQLRLIFIVFGASWAWLAAVVVAMFCYALKQRTSLQLSEPEHRDAILYICTYGVLSLSGITSIIIAVTASDDLIELAGYQYFLLLSIPLITWAVRRRIRGPWHRGTE